MLRGFMNLNVPDLRKGLRRTKNKQPENSGKERRKTEDRRILDAEPVKVNKAKRVWLTPKMKALIEDLFFLNDK
ncbi:hypothetical protein MCAMS1_00107 [biofilm metagenome]